MQKELPYGCSEDFRYIVPTIFTSLTLLGFIQKDTKKTPCTGRTLKDRIFVARCTAPQAAIREAK